MHRGDPDSGSPRPHSEVWSLQSNKFGARKVNKQERHSPNHPGMPTAEEQGPNLIEDKTSILDKSCSVTHNWEQIT